MGRLPFAAGEFAFVRSQGGNRATKDDDPLYEIVSAAFPKRELVDRALIDAVARQIEYWKRLSSENDPNTHADSIERLVTVRDGAMAAIDKAIARLRGVAAAKGAEYLEEGLAVDPRKIPLRAERATINLYLVLQHAHEELRSWHRPQRRGKGRPAAFSVSLTKNLRQLCCDLGGFSRYEFEQFLSVLNDNKSITGLPTLSIATPKKQKQRAKKIAGTK